MSCLGRSLTFGLVLGALALLGCGPGQAPTGPGAAALHRFEDMEVWVSNADGPLVRAEIRRETGEVLGSMQYTREDRRLQWSFSVPTKAIKWSQSRSGSRIAGGETLDFDPPSGSFGIIARVLWEDETRFGTFDLEQNPKPKPRICACEWQQICCLCYRGTCLQCSPVCV